MACFNQANRKFICVILRTANAWVKKTCYDSDMHNLATNQMSVKFTSHTGFDRLFAKISCILFLVKPLPKAIMLNMSAPVALILPEME